MYPFSSLQSIYHVAFLSELSLLFLFICSISSSSASTLQLKRFLIQTAYNLRNETPSKEIGEGKKEEENDNEKEENSWKELFDRLKLYHVVLGNQLNHPVVLFDEDGYESKGIGKLEYVNYQHHVSSTSQYEKVITSMNKLYPKNSCYPVCLACITNYISYPFNHCLFIRFR